MKKPASGHVFENFHSDLYVFYSIFLDYQSLNLRRFKFRVEALFVDGLVNSSSSDSAHKSYVIRKSSSFFLSPSVQF